MMRSFGREKFKEVELGPSKTKKESSEKDGSQTQRVRFAVRKRGDVRDALVRNKTTLRREFEI